jgi:hypothetical protein
MKRKYNTLCIDCGTETQPRNHIGKYGQFLVTDKVWRAAGMPKATIDPWTMEIHGGGGCLCISCIEKRLGGALTPAAFMPVRLDLYFWRLRAGWYTPRLAARLEELIAVALRAISEGGEAAQRKKARRAWLAKRRKRR